MTIALLISRAVITNTCPDWLPEWYCFLFFSPVRVGFSVLCFSLFVWALRGELRRGRA